MGNSKLVHHPRIPHPFGALVHFLPQDSVVCQHHSPDFIKLFGTQFGENTGKGSIQASNAATETEFGPLEAPDDLARFPLVYFHSTCSILPTVHLS